MTIQLQVGQRYVPRWLAEGRTHATLPGGSSGSTGLASTWYTITGMSGSQCAGIGNLADPHDVIRFTARGTYCGIGDDCDLNLVAEYAEPQEVLASKVLSVVAAPNRAVADRNLWYQYYAKRKFLIATRGMDGAAIGIDLAYVRAALRGLRQRLAEAGRYSYRLTYRGHAVTVNTTERSVASLASMLKEARRRVGEVRRAARVLATRVRRIGNLVVSTTGYVHTEPDTIAKLALLRRGKLLATQKTPRTTAPHLGVEIECCLPNGTERLKQLLLDGRLANYVNLGTDGSVHPDNNDHDGCELRVLASQADMPDIMRRVCDCLAKVGAYVNKTCGLHVHIDARPGVRVVAELYESLRLAQPLFMKLVPVSRRSNRFCRPGRAMKWVDARRCGERYRAINTRSYHDHSTIEVRIHSSTVSATKINYWCQLLVAIADGKLTALAKTPRGLGERLSLSEEMITYFESRVAKFARGDDAEEAYFADDAEVNECEDCGCEISSSHTHCNVCAASYDEDEEDCA